MTENLFNDTPITLAIIQAELKITTIVEPYDYVRKVQASFDYSQLRFSDEYYEKTGLERPS